MVRIKGGDPRGVLGQASFRKNSYPPFNKCVGLCSCTLAPSTSALGRPIHWACLNCDNSCCCCCCHVHQLLCTCCVHNKAPPTLHQIGVVKQIPHHTHPFFSSFYFHNCFVLLQPLFSRKYITSTSHKLWEKDPMLKRINVPVKMQ